MKTLKKILILIVLVIVIGLVMAILDYQRINHNKKPIFVLETYNKRNKENNYRGLFHEINRTCSVSNKEQISDSKKITYKFISFNINVNQKVLNPNKVLKVNTTEETKCNPSKLIFANEVIKVYTYCIENIKIDNDGNEEELLNYLKKDDYNYKNIIKELTYSGFSRDNVSLESIDNKNISNNGLKVIECRLNENRDIYIGPANMVYQEDFCTYKDDDFEFMWKVNDITPNEFKCPENPVPEVIFEDEKNRYEFDCQKSEYVFVTTPALRGKPQVDIPIKDALINNLVTIEEAQKRGLKCDIINKEEEAKKNNIN